VDECKSLDDGIAEPHWCFGLGRTALMCWRNHTVMCTTVNISVSARITTIMPDEVTVA